MSTIRIDTVIDAVLSELITALGKFPTWPTDPLHAVAILGEEFGELTRAVMQASYEPHKGGPLEVRAEALQTAAMAIRFLVGLDAYKYRAGEQQQPALGWGKGQSDHFPRSAEMRRVAPAVCSCPSGDGSLRWPCAAHSPDREAADNLLAGIAQALGAKPSAEDLYDLFNPAWQRALTPNPPAGMVERLKSAQQRIVDGHAPRRIPADPTDADLVIGEVLSWLEGRPAPGWVPAPPSSDGADA